MGRLSVSTVPTDAKIVSMWMVQRLGTEDSPVEKFGIFRLDNRQWVLVDYTLTEKQAHEMVLTLSEGNAILWRV